MNSLNDEEVMDYLLECQSFILAGSVKDWTDRFNPAAIPRVKRRRIAPASVIFRELPACRECKSLDVIEDVKQGSIVCTDCGLVQSHYIFTTTFKDRENCSLRTVHRYSRIVYFKSLLKAMMGETSPDLTKSDIDKICKKLTTPVTPASIHVALKQCGLQRLSRHKVTLASVFGGYKGALVIDSADFRELLRLFRHVEVEFDKTKRKRRIFLSYPYLFYQLCVHMDRLKYSGQHHLLKCKHLLARQHKLYGPIAKQLGFTCDLDVFRVK